MLSRKPLLTTKNPKLEKLKFIAHKLRDGKLLCDLLVKLDPGCFSRNKIRYIKSHEHLRMSEFNCSQNINWFLQILDREFQIKVGLVKSFYFFTEKVVANPERIPLKLQICITIIIFEQC